MKRIKVLLIVFIAIVLSSCGASKRTSSNTVESDLLSQFEIYKNTKYKYGGTDERGFDCSGFVNKVYSNAFGIQLPRTTDAMSKVGTKISKNKLKPGDLVFFRPSRKYDHVGIFIDDNIFIHSSTSKGVIKSKLDNPYWKKKYRFAKRIFKSK